MSAIDEIGFLDDEYGFYHEDADFGFRLRKAGYGCAYMPKSQIDHFRGSTFNREGLIRKATYIVKNKMYLAKKHLGYGMHHELDNTISDGEQAALNRDMHSYLQRYGLLDRSASELIVSSPEQNSKAISTRPSRQPNCLNAGPITIESTAPSSRHPRGCRVSSPVWGSPTVSMFRSASSQIYFIRGAKRQIYDETTYLAIIDGRRSGLLPAILKSWHRFAGPGRTARLILLGRGLNDFMGRAPDTIHRSGAVDIAHYEVERIDVHQILSPLSDRDLAQFYRGADYTILCPTAAGSTLAALGSMACGVPCIFNGSWTAFETSLAVPAAFDTSLISRDNAIGASGSREAIVEYLVGRLEHSDHLSARDRAALASEAAYKVRGQSTLRNTAIGFYAALARIQDQDPARIVKTLDRNRASTIQAITQPGEASPTTSATRAAKLSGSVARQLNTVGRLTADFGSVWQEKGFTAASGIAVGELRYSVARRSKRFLRLKGRALEMARATTERAIRPLMHYTPPKPRSALLIGYIDAQLGLGQSLRGLAMAMSQSAVQFSIYPFGVGVEGRRSAAYMPERYDTANAHAVNIIEVTPDELPTVFRHVSRRHFDRSYNILRTYWELSRAPEAWRPRLGTIDEIWAPNALRGPELPGHFRASDHDRSSLHRSAGKRTGRTSTFRSGHAALLFPFLVRLFLVPAQKNPLAVVRAFRAAFPNTSVRVGLVIKCIGPIKQFSQVREELRSAAELDGRIEVMDESLTREEMLTLMATVDCYVSLHRSEGFGLGMAEALALGKPVIGTGYSGNTAFLTEETGYPIPYPLREIAHNRVCPHSRPSLGRAGPGRLRRRHASGLQGPRGGRNQGPCGPAFGGGQITGPFNVNKLVQRRLNEIFDRE